MCNSLSTDMIACGGGGARPREIMEAGIASAEARRKRKDDGEVRPRCRRGVQSRLGSGGEQQQANSELVGNIAIARRSYGLLCVVGLCTLNQAEG
jgi:hypothetical protein